MQVIEKKQSYCDDWGDFVFSITQSFIGQPNFQLSLVVPNMVKFSTQEDVEFFINELEKAWSNSPC